MARRKPAGAQSAEHAERHHRDTGFGTGAGADARRPRSRSHRRSHHRGIGGRRRLARRHRRGGRCRRLRLPCARRSARRPAESGRRRPRARRGCCFCSPAPCSMPPGSAKPGISSSNPSPTPTRPCSGAAPTASRRCARRCRSLLAALVARPSPEQGLIISKQFYDRLGGHAEHAADPEAEFIRRLGRRRAVTLSAAAFQSR